MENLDLLEKAEDSQNTASGNSDCRWDPESNGTKLDMEYYDELHSVVGFLWLYCAGESLSSVLFAFNKNSMLLGIAAVVSVLCSLGWCIYVVWRITHRKPNAVFQARAFLIVSMIGNVCGLFLSPSVFGIALTIVNVVCLFRVFMSSDFSVVFPKEYRSHSILDWVLIGAFFVIPTVVSFLCSLAVLFIGF